MRVGRMRRFSFTAFLRAVLMGVPGGTRGKRPRPFLGVIGNLVDVDESSPLVLESKAADTSSDNSLSDKGGSSDLAFADEEDVIVSVPASALADDVDLFFCFFVICVVVSSFLYFAVFREREVDTK